MAPFLWATTNLNPIANVLTYTIRHRELLVGMQYLFGRAELTKQRLKNIMAQKHLGASKS